jgi:limonene-1,2-epoxide hydrolase
MHTREVVELFWSAMKSNDWARAASHLADDCIVDWPCSGERIIGREDFAAMQARYPTNTGRWTFDVHRIVVEDDVAVSDVTVTDGEQSAQVIVFSFVDAERIRRQLEYWLMAYDPPPGREDLTRTIAHVP